MYKGVFEETQKYIWESIFLVVKHALVSVADCLGGLGMRMKCGCVQGVSTSYERLPNIAASLAELSRRGEDKENNDSEVSVRILLKKCHG